MAERKRLFSDGVFFKRAQVWSLDLIIAAVIFSVSIVILYIYAINNNSGNESELESLFYEGNLASDLILSDGEYGILTDSRIDQDKLNLMCPDYSVWRKHLGLVNNFYFVVPGLEIGGASVGYGGLYNGTAENVVQITRVTIYKNSPVKFELFIWS